MDPPGGYVPRPSTRLGVEGFPLWVGREEWKYYVVCKIKQVVMMMFVLVVSLRSYLCSQQPASFHHVDETDIGFSCTYLHNPSHRTGKTE